MTTQLHAAVRTSNQAEHPNASFYVVHQILAEHNPKYIQRPAEVRPEEQPKTAAAVAGTGGGPEQTLTQHEIIQDREQELRRSNPWQGHFFR